MLEKMMGSAIKAIEETTNNMHENSDRKNGQ